MNHGLDGVFGIQFAFVGTNFIYNYFGIFFEKILPVYFVCSVKKFIKIECIVTCQLQKDSVCSSKAKICFKKRIVIAKKRNASRGISSKFISKMFDFVAKNFFCSNGTQRNKCIHNIKFNIFSKSVQLSF